MGLRILAAAVLVVLALAGCGSSSAVSTDSTSRAHATPGAAAGFPKARPQAIEPTVGQHASSVDPGAPVGDPTAHAPSLAEVRSELRLELIAAPVTNGAYIDPLQDVTRWERTDQGVDATLAVGAPILAPSAVKILAIIPNWYAGQPLVYFELLAGPDAGRVQYVAEQITAIARPGTILRQGQVDAERRDAGEGHDRLRGGAGHPGRPLDARLAEWPRRQRRRQLIAPAQPSVERAVREHEAQWRRRDRGVGVVHPRAVQATRCRRRRNRVGLAGVGGDPVHDGRKVAPVGEDRRPLDDNTPGRVRA
jgi:hypothetical protein